MSFLSNAAAGLKRFTSMVFRKSSYRMFSLLGTRVNYEEEVGDGTGSSTVAAVLNWVARTFPEAPPALWKEIADGQEEQIRQHDILKLLRRPNEFYSGVILWMATVIDWMVDGNAYWLKVRTGTGQVGELWWVPHWLMCPKGDDSTFISYYEYTPDGSQKLRVDPEDVVHFRFGLDPDDAKLGMSQLKSVLREVFTDDEAANFTASLLRNMGVPGLIVSPEKGTTISPDDAASAKEYLQAQFTGDKRGAPLVNTGPTQIAQFGFSPEQLLLRELRRIPEERVSAVTGIPAIVVGFGAGLERSTFTNMGEAREAAYEAGLIPMQRIMAEDVLFQLLPDFEEDVYQFRFGFDLSKVRVLQTDQHALAQRHNLAIMGGWELVSEGRRAMGLRVGPEHEIFLRPANYVEVPDDGSAPRPLAPPQTPPAAIAALEQRLENVARGQDDVKALVREWKPAAPPQVNFHAGAITAEAPQVTVEPAQVTVEAPPPAEITVEAAPPPNLEIHVPDTRPRQAVARRNGDGAIVVTYDGEEPDGG